MDLGNLARRPGEMLSSFAPYYDATAIAIALVLAGGVTYISWEFAWNAAIAEARSRFEFRVAQIGESARGRMADYEQVLRGGVGLFAASVSVERGEWRDYVAHLRLGEGYPGIQSISYARRVPGPMKARHEQEVLASGVSPYSIQPPGARPEYFPIVYIEPFSGRNLRALGYDAYADATRRAAMERARDTGEATLSGKVTLVQETGEDVQAGMIMYMPVYRNDLDSGTPSLRRAALAGYVSASFRMNDLMTGMLGKLPGVRLELFDGGAVDRRALLYDSAPGDARPNPLFERTATVPMRGATWTVRVSSLPDFEETVDRRTPRAVAIGVGLVSALVLAIIWSLATLRARAMRLARSMTRGLRESEERLALALEGSNEALFDWNIATGTVTLSERWSRLTGHPLETSITALQQLVHPDDVTEVRRQVAGVLRGELPHYHVEHRVQTASGDWRWISSRAKVVERDPLGRAARVAGTNTDITDRKAIERIKNEFIATVSHELRTPLTALIGSLGLLRELAAGKLESEAATFLSMAQQNSDRLAALINDILDIEKIESGSASFRAEPVELPPLLGRAVELNAPYAAALGVRFELAAPLPAATVTGDGDRLVQVLTNFMSNAAKFSPAGSAVTISAQAREGRVRVAVTDRGPGIPEEFRGRVFEKFAQADSSDTRQKGGTGLGLSISRAIIEKMGGTVGFESAPGRGATFYFELPLR